MADDAPPAAVDEATANMTQQDAPVNDLDSMPPQEQLAHLTARATAEYAVKHYSEAAELYSQASEIQAELNGDMAVENADLLFAYGKCLFFLAQQTSSVLGGTAAAGQLTNKQKEGKPKKKKAKAETNGGSAGAEASSSAVVKESDIKPAADAADASTDPSKPFFQISGDTADWSSDEDEPEPNGAEEEEEEEDDFANSYELLDLARILYLRKLESLPPTTDSTPATMDPSVRDTKSRIAEIHDLQSEVLLESEKYALAAADLSKALALREELDPPESALLAECHYKLSLALEFASQSQQRDNDGNPVGDIEIDWKIRDQSITHQEKAIESCKLRVEKETTTLSSMPEGKEHDKLKADIDDVSDMITEMQQRLADLRKPPVNVKEETEMKEQLAGVLGTLMGATKEEKEETLAKVVGGATDIGSMVKKKKKKVGFEDVGSGVGSAASTPGPEVNGNGNGKRKVEFADEAEGKGKKARVEEVEDSGK
jgi:HAT1-interacting factor 1